MLVRFARLVQSRLFLHYLGASICALAVDVGFFLLLLKASMPAPTASAVSFSFGIAVHWLISSRLVFAGQAAPHGPERWRQKGLFLVSAAVGLILTVAIVTGGQMAGIDPRLAKLVAIGFSFATTFFIRRTVVFAAR